MSALRVMMVESLMSCGTVPSHQHWQRSLCSLSRTAGLPHLRTSVVMPSLPGALPQDRNEHFTTHISYLEIYNEMGFDLLESRNEAYRLDDLQKVTIMEDLDHNIHLKNLSLQLSVNEEEALNLLFLGDINRVIAKTPMNQASTRSHCIFTIHIRKREPGCATMRHSKLHLVDLAGSERVSKSGLSGQLLTEAKYINRSLHYLEQVIIALSETDRPHIPYRNSLLTSVLRDSLGGNCMTTMIATIAVDNGNLEESISTCRFSQRVAVINNNPILNEILDPDLLITHLKMEVQCLKEELSLVKEGQRNDRLTVEEIERLHELVKIFLDDPDPEVALSVGADMRKIQYCFCWLKRMIMDKQEKRRMCSDAQKSATVNKVLKACPQSSEERSILKKMLMQRDQEISNLVRMLKNNNPAWFADIKGGLALPCQSEINVYKPQGNVNTMPVESEAQTVLQQMKTNEEPFETFMGSEDNLTIDKNIISRLKQRVTEARRLGEQLKVSKNRIHEMKKQLASQRKQMATNDVTWNHTEAEEEDLVIKSLSLQIEQEKTNYKTVISHLKELRRKIERQQLYLA
ncbi:kinesin-like protein KIF6 isoform X2 [Takifugu flavidus]|uniref:kinesin-like protein KIF6 isoform X2 n=1 Tax=Takifugu flavidus TaxID=433684 RepID=UPI00254447F0|nr:kinesin-like protein KIF6 isoform X2 [Takifugu flavidus]